MFPKRMVHIGDKVWGQMPSGEILEFDSQFMYAIAYAAEEDEIVDELARLEELNTPDDLQNDMFMYA